MMLPSLSKQQSTSFRAIRRHASIFLLLASNNFLGDILLLVDGHVRWKCPLPRSRETGLKMGPCGRETEGGGPPLEYYYDDDSGQPPSTVLKPGPLQVVFEESVFHLGSPFRISLSGDGTDDKDTCVLLDHIPHNDNPHPLPFPNINYESTYVPYVITIEIPNVDCEMCSLHLSNPMTDKIQDEGLPDGEGCTDPNGTCLSVYHSCTIPFRIISDNPETAIRRSQYECPYNTNHPTDWPTLWTSSDNGQSVTAAIPGVYRRETSYWDNDSHKLQKYTVGHQYRQDVHEGENNGICAATMSSSATSASSILSTSIWSLSILLPFTIWIDFL